MPINRPDGRHWCAPEREPVPEDGTVWACPDCGKEWAFALDNSTGGGVWSEPAEDD